MNLVADEGLKGANVIRATMICTGPSNQRFQSRLFHLLDQQRLAPLNFVSIRLESLIWTKFQIEGSCAQIVRLRAKILGLNGVDLCSELQVRALPFAQKAAADGIRSLGIEKSFEDQKKKGMPTFKGLQ